MALQQIFTDIANAIRSKKGYNTKEEYPIYPYDMADEIEEISTDGGELVKGSAAAQAFTMMDVTSAATLGQISITATANAALTE